MCFTRQVVLISEFTKKAQYESTEMTTRRNCVIVLLVVILLGTRTREERHWYNSNMKPQAILGLHTVLVHPRSCSESSRGLIQWFI